MFKQELENKFKQIFGIDKVVYDTPGESKEQNCLFIEVEDCRPHIIDGFASGKVTGNAVIFQKSSAIPYGFFAKAIAKADAALTKDLFFFDLEANTQRYRDLVQRGFSFTYFFNSQFDPPTGTITSVNTTVEES